MMPEQRNAAANGGQHACEAPWRLLLSGQAHVNPALPPAAAQPAAATHSPNPAWAAQLTTLLHRAPPRTPRSGGARMGCRAKKIKNKIKIPRAQVHAACVPLQSASAHPASPYQRVCHCALPPTSLSCSSMCAPAQHAAQAATHTLPCWPAPARPAAHCACGPSAAHPLNIHVTLTLDKQPRLPAAEGA